MEVITFYSFLQSRILEAKNSVINGYQIPWLIDFMDLTLKLNLAMDLMFKESKQLQHLIKLQIHLYFILLALKHINFGLEILVTFALMLWSLQD